MGADQASEAVVLRRIDSGENDRRLVLLTRDFGKIDVIAKGSRKPGSRLCGSSEPLVRAKFGWASGRARRFVTQVEPITSFPRLRQDYNRLLSALAFAETVSVAVSYESVGPDSIDLYGLVIDCLQQIESFSNWKSAFVWAQAKLMEAEGLHPSWLVCSATSSPVQENPAFVSPSAGGYVSSEVRAQFNDVVIASVEALMAMDRIVELEKPPQNILEADECLKLLFVFWQHHLESKLPSFRSLLQGISANKG